MGQQKANIHSMPISEEVKDVNCLGRHHKPCRSGNQYKVRALIADPSIEELRSAGTEYPAWVTDRYLQVPEEIAPQLRELALEITAPHDTVYDKVQAITTYLRKEIKYETTIDSTLCLKTATPCCGFCLSTKKDSACTMPAQKR